MTRPLENAARFILGIESSCDETACALVDREGRAAANAVASQVDLHARFGGVVPEVAARMHIQACLPLVDEAMAAAGAGWDQIEAVAVTRGPGLAGCLLVGIETAKALAWLHDKPLVAVNHLAGHLYALNVAPLDGAHTLIERGGEVKVLPVERGIAAAGAQGPGAGGDGAIRVAWPEYPHLGLIVSGGHTSLV
ncbi:MAG: tRNA (adenosine(37)-N6)-threonylcarbamoyltransferase complex transferase subunit TsaD, partial [bacterium]|nr:tRNA (adenosine(37)-N6)-threonylcarbamoyltransferase complex transferase subunit TsaD [bacterium]